MTPTAQELYALIMLSSDFCWTLDVGQRFNDLYGPLIDAGEIDASLLLGHRLDELCEPRQPALDDLARGHSFANLRVSLPLTTGTRHDFALHGLAINREGVGSHRGIAIDLTRRFPQDASLHQMAYHDALTGLPNRRLFADRLQQAIHQARRRGTRLAVMMADIDQFKTINDRYGHTAGDRALIDIARALHDAIRRSDTVGRHGGDEFVVLLPQIKSERDATLVAAKINEALGELMPQSVSASLGIALFPDHGWDIESLLAQADAGLYEAKRQGGGRAVIAQGVAKKVG